MPTDYHGFNTNFTVPQHDPLIGGDVVEEEGLEVGFKQLGISQICDAEH